MDRTAAPACRTLGLAARNARYVYYPSRSGYIVACSKMTAALHLPFHGIVVIAADDDMHIEVSSGRQAMRLQALAACPRALHIDSPSTPLVCVVANPLHADFRAFRLLQRPYCAPLERRLFRTLDEPLHAALEGSLGDNDGASLFNGVLTRVRNHLPSPRDRDPRAQQLVEFLWAHPKCTLAELARHLKLSYGRTSHLFADAVGVSVRSYQLWQKMYQATAALIAGATITQAAYAAGFSDAAHFSSAFQRAYGCAPTFIFKNAHVKLASHRHDNAEGAPADPLEIPDDRMKPVRDSHSIQAQRGVT